MAMSKVHIYQNWNSGAWMVACRLAPWKQVRLKVLLIEGLRSKIHQKQKKIVEIHARQESSRC